MLEWTVRLESDGILGENMQFSQEEKDVAQAIPQQINYYFGTVYSGDMEHVEVISGDKTVVTFTNQQVCDLLRQLKESIETDGLTEEDKVSATELINEVEKKVKASKKPAIIKAGLSGLREFLIASGASVSAGLILQWMQGLM